MYFGRRNKGIVKAVGAGGQFAMVHRPDRLVDIIWLMRNTP